MHTAGPAKGHWKWDHLAAAMKTPAEALARYGRVVLAHLNERPDEGGPVYQVRDKRSWSSPQDSDPVVTGSRLSASSLLPLISAWMYTFSWLAVCRIVVLCADKGRGIHSQKRLVSPVITQC